MLRALAGEAAPELALRSHAWRAYSAMLLWLAIHEADRDAAPVVRRDE